MKTIVFLFLFFLLFSSFAHAQQVPAHQGISMIEIYLSLGILTFGLIILGLQIIVMLKFGKGWESNSIRISGITLIIIAGLFLITAGYSQDQIAPMVGLLGTIAGYLLGKTETKS
jgi:hypothetical protein